MSGGLADLFTPDAVWEGAGPLYTEKFGRTSGPVAIAAMLSPYLPPNPHFRANAHLLHPGTTRTEGDEVRGRSLMQQVSRYASSEAELIVARLDVAFRVTTGGALIRHAGRGRNAGCGSPPGAAGRGPRSWRSGTWGTGRPARTGSWVRLRWLVHRRSELMGRQVYPRTRPRGGGPALWADGVVLRRSDRRRPRGRRCAACPSAPA
ncbi:nuclear transport factor 2 family protein [Streptomyces hygroscopicus]|uniref:nuclear transport factor 2 family protein n=1 Tax=Streptomyces hygroscopicus TaxID=1912 RepID=UPI0036CCA362